MSQVLILLCVLAVKGAGSNNLTHSATTPTTSHTQHNGNGNQTMLLTAEGKPHDTSRLMNMNDIMTMNPYNLPTIEENFYTSLVSKHANRSTFVMTIPDGIEDAYSQSVSQYMKRLMNKGTLPANFQQRVIKRNHQQFNPDSFKLTAYDCDEPTNIKNLRHKPNGDCLKEELNGEVMENTFTVIQETNTRRHNGYRCVMLETRRTYQCGGFDHSINVDDLT